MSFLEVNIIREKDKFTTYIYRKPTFSGIYTHFDSFLPSSNKIGLLHTLLYRFFRICSDWTKSHLELVKLIDVFKNNAFPENVINNCFEVFLDKLTYFSQGKDKIFFYRMSSGTGHIHSKKTCIVRYVSFV